MVAYLSDEIECSGYVYIGQQLQTKVRTRTKENRIVGTRYGLSIALGEV